MEQFDLARAALLAGRRDEARSLLMQFIRQNPGHGEGWYLLGQALDDPAQRADCEARARAAGFNPPVSAPQPSIKHPAPSPQQPAALPATFSQELPAVLQAAYLPPASSFESSQATSANAPAPARAPNKGLAAIAALLGVLVLAGLGWIGYRQFAAAPATPTPDQSAALVAAPATRTPRPTRVPRTATPAPTRAPVPTPTLPQIVPVTVTPGPATAGGGSVAAGSRGGRIAYGKTSQPGQIDLYVADSSGRNPRRLTDLPGIETSPAWSRDGKKLAFIATTDSRDPNDCYSGLVDLKCNFEIYSIGADGGGLRRVTNNDGYEREPSWSPDGSRIAYQSLRNLPIGRYTQLYMIGADGKNEVQLTNEKAGFEDVDWSPTGNAIVFARIDGQESDIYAMDVDTRAMTRLTNNGRLNYWPVWSQDGARIAFLSRTQTSDAALYVMNADGSGERLIDSDHPIIDGYRPTWSPDGTEIAFVSNLAGTYSVYAVDLATNAVRAVTPSDTRYTAPAWSPR